MPVRALAQCVPISGRTICVQIHSYPEVGQYAHHVEACPLPEYTLTRRSGSLSRALSTYGRSSLHLTARSPYPWGASFVSCRYDQIGSYPSRLLAARLAGSWPSFSHNGSQLRIPLSIVRSLRFLSFYSPRISIATWGVYSHLQVFGILLRR